LIGEYFVRFCRYHFEREYLIDKDLTDKDKDVEIIKMTLRVFGTSESQSARVLFTDL
jgi:hypothetical protein